MQERATSAAKIEYFFQRIALPNAYGAITHVPELYGYSVINVGMYNNGERVAPKAITVRDPNGNIIVHFNGTGDGFWGYNDAAFDAPPQPSPIQVWSADYFDRIYDRYLRGNNESIYLTGHSQGGNNAKYATMRSGNRDSIVNCIAIDAPGFSFQFERDTVNMYGRDAFNHQSGKIWAFNGTHDFVSPLGQVHITPEGQVVFIHQYDPEGFKCYHHIRGRFQRDKDGNIIFELTIADGPSEFRKLVAALNEHVSDLPHGQQARMAYLAMKLANAISVVTDDNGVVLNYLWDNVSPEEFDELLRIVGPILVDFLADNPDMIGPVLGELFGFDQARIDAITNLLGHFNNLSVEDRRVALAAILNMITFDEYGKFDIDKNWRDIADALIAAWPAVLEALANGGLSDLLEAMGIDARIALILKIPKVGQVIVAVALIIIGVITIARWIRDIWNARGQRYADANP